MKILKRKLGVNNVRYFFLFLKFQSFSCSVNLKKPKKIQIHNTPVNVKWSW